MYTLRFKLIDGFVKPIVYLRCVDLSLFSSCTTSSQKSLSSTSNTDCKTVPWAAEIDCEIRNLFAPLFNVVVVGSKSSFLTARKNERPTKYTVLNDDHRLAVYNEMLDVADNMKLI